MSEIYRNAQGKGVTLGVTGAVSVSARLLRGTATPIVAVVSAFNVTDHMALIPYAITHLDGDFTIEWTYTVEGNVYVKSFTHSIVTPLMPLSALSTQDAMELEQAVRYFIQAYTNNYFGSFVGTVTIQGTGHMALELPRRLRSLTSVTLDGTAYDPAGFVLTGDGWFLNRTAGRSLTIKDAPPDEYVPVYSNNLIVPPFSPVNTMFVDNTTFVIDGVWGYDPVPDDVMLAADLLFNDYNCADAAYRNRFINSMRAGNWRFDLRDDAFAGTGNLTADRLLDKYRNDLMVII